MIDKESSQVGFAESGDGKGISQGHHNMTGTPVDSKPLFRHSSLTESLNKVKRKRESTSDGRHEPIKLAANPFNMTARNFPKRRHMKNTIVVLNRTRANSSSPARALELVRAALQPSLNSEIERVLQSYQEMFRMAAYNIADNTNESVTEDHVNHILRRSLDEAKSLFRVSECKEGEQEPKQHKVPVRVARAPIFIKKKKMRSRDDHREVKQKDNYPYPPWNELRINESCEFIMGVKANKILGYASARGRVYVRHPELFKYMGDQDDKQWLYENKLMPTTGGKAFVMLADDIRGLLRNHEDYRDNIPMKPEDVKGFRAPKFMLDKIRAAMHRGAMIREAANRKYEESLERKAAAE